MAVAVDGTEACRLRHERLGCSSRYGGRKSQRRRRWRRTEPWDLLRHGGQRNQRRQRWRRKARQPTVLAMGVSEAHQGAEARRGLGGQFLRHGAIGPSGRRRAPPRASRMLMTAWRADKPTKTAMAADGPMGLTTAWRPEEPATTGMAEEGTATYRLGHGRLGGSSGRAPKPEEPTGMASAANSSGTGPSDHLEE